tara:strand:+ start:239 stop:1114 length:876 start_codon:yes stop_codon:yes gene_type:complete
MPHITIGTAATTVTYTATASQTAFSIPFEFFAAADLKVYQNTVLLTLATHYTVTPVTVYEGGYQGGTVTLVTGATVSDLVTIDLDMTPQRATDFAVSGPFNITTLNTWIDKVMVLLKQLKTKLDNSVSRHPSDTTTYSTTLPTDVGSVAKVLMVDTTSGITLGSDVSEISGALASSVAAAASAAAAAVSADAAESFSGAQANQAEAEAGTNATKIMAPLRVKQAITFNQGLISNAAFYGFRVSGAELFLDQTTPGGSETFTATDYDMDIIAAQGLTFAISATTGIMTMTTP